MLVAAIFRRASGFAAAATHEQDGFRSSRCRTAAFETMNDAILTWKTAKLGTLPLLILSARRNYSVASLAPRQAKLLDAQHAMQQSMAALSSLRHCLLGGCRSCHPDKQSRAGRSCRGRDGPHTPKPFSTRQASSNHRTAFSGNVTLASVKVLT